MQALLQKIAWYVGIAGLGAVAAILTGVWIESRGEDVNRRPTVNHPVEFLYLDESRVKAYLSQFDFGSATQVTRVESLTRSVGGKVSPSVFELSASAQDTRSEQRVLAPTGVGAFSDVARRLKPTTLNLNDPRKLLDQHDALHEGEVIRLKTRKLFFPHYIAPYIVVRQYATLKALFPRHGGARQSARRFARRIGPNPRITLAVQARVGEALVRYLLPVQYEGLANERSLFAGGTLTIVGKVVRLFRLRSTSLHDEDDVPRVTYRDLATRETWRGPLRGMPEPLYERIRSAKRLARDCRLKKLELGRNCLRRALQRQTTVPGPGAVVLPLAIYK